jgi:hypothetical protein
VRRSYAVAVLVLVLALAAGGCGAGQAKYPPECSDGPPALRSALAQAPDGDVAMSGVKLSDCLVPSGDAGPLTVFGGAVIDVAARLADRAHAGDERAELELGFLRGALYRGADSGLHDDLLRRLDQELLRVDVTSAAFRRGESAGRARG